VATLGAKGKEFIMTKTTWSVSNFKPIDKGSVAASFSVEAPHFKIHNCLYFKKDGKRWIGWPSRQYETDTGSKAWAVIVEPAEFLKRRMNDWILEELKKLEPAAPEPDDKFHADPDGEDFPF
jgi:hypothetical protein